MAGVVDMTNSKIVSIIPMVSMKRVDKVKSSEFFTIINKAFSKFDKHATF